QRFTSVPSASGRRKSLLRQLSVALIVTVRCLADRLGNWGAAVDYLRLLRVPFGPVDICKHTWRIGPRLGFRLGGENTGYSRGPRYGSSSPPKSIRTVFWHMHLPIQRTLFALES